MKYLFILVPFLFLGCENHYSKLHIDFDCRDGELYGTMYLGSYLTEDENVSKPEYYKGSEKVTTTDGSIITCKEATK